MKVLWGPLNEIVTATGYGYSTASINLRDALARVCEVTTNPEDSADVAVHLCHPDIFKPVKQCPNFLFTMFEHHPLPVEFVRAAYTGCDALIVPSKFNEQLFREWINPMPVPIVVSRLGFDPAVFCPTFAPKGAKPPFRFLFVGDFNQRKGFHVLMDTWAQFRDAPGVELYMKISSASEKPKWFRREADQVIWDERKLTRAQMAALYKMANVFVFPSMGEGFGLTALEAAATGIPIVTTDCGGVDEFLGRRDAWWVPTQKWYLRGPQGTIYKGKRCMPLDLGKVMLDVFRNYPLAVRNARKLAYELRSTFTWAAAAEELHGHLKGLLARKAA